MRNVTTYTTRMTKFPKSLTQWHVNRHSYGLADSKKYMLCRIYTSFSCCIEWSNTGKHIQKNATLEVKFLFYQKRLGFRGVENIKMADLEYEI